jgi:hypothetical protein
MAFSAYPKIIEVNFNLLVFQISFENLTMNERQPSGLYDAAMLANVVISNLFREAYAAVGNM